MAEKQAHDIREKKVFVDSRGREVVTFTQVFGKSPEPDLVKGVVTLRIGMMTPNGIPLPPQDVRMEFSFPSGTSLKRAFETFDELSNAEVEKFKAERMAASKKIVGARAPLLGADGRPV